MSVSTEVQRTLVKSPPELWSELSNPEALARHLSDLGEIRITAVEPETKVEWESEGASGIVRLKQSGWGTKVTLSVTRATPVGEEESPESEAIAEPEPAVIEADPIAVVEPKVANDTASEPTATEPVDVVKPEPEPIAVEPEVRATDIVAANPTGEVERELEPGAVVEAETVAEPEPRVGFFARLFRRRKTRQHEAVEARAEPRSATQAEPGSAARPEPEIEIEALAAPEPIYPERLVEVEPEPVEPAVDLAAELASVEAQMTAETTELLTGVLDRLGAAHHRPFSRG
jgi:hypothetical protein